MKKASYISIIIPVYKKTEMFLNNLQNNWNYIKDYEVIVIDDASGEKLKEKLNNLFPSIICIVNQKNTGFGSSMNSGINKATGDYLLFLNSDVILEDFSFLTAENILEDNKSLFAISFAQREDNKVVGKNKVFWERGLIQHSKQEDMESGFSAWAEGGACMIRAEYMKRLNGFDERLSPFYGEDIDLSLRAKRNGWKIWFESKIQVIHKHETTIGTYFNRDYIQEIALRNQVLYSWKNSSILQKLSMIVFMIYYLLFYLKEGKISLLRGYLNGWKLIFK